MKKLLFLFLIVIFSCQEKQTKINVIKPSVKISSAKILKKKSKTIKMDSLQYEILDTFKDSLKIGKKRKSKVEKIQFVKNDQKYTQIKFFTKSKVSNIDKWIMQNDYLFETNSLTGLDINISDFNNDKLNDLTFVSATAARGANEVHRLLVYNDNKQKLISIKNSESYPNMLYNKDYDCIDAFLVYGGCATVFLKIKGDSLKKFAKVESFEDLTISTYDKNDVEKIILKKTDVNQSYIRYKNFKPLLESDNY